MELKLRMTEADLIEAYKAKILTTLIECIPDTDHVVDAEIKINVSPGVNDGTKR